MCFVGMEFPGEATGIEDQVVAFRRPVLELHLRAALYPRDVEHSRVDVARARGFVQQLPHEVGGKVVRIGHLLRRKVMGEVSIAPTPSLERDTVLAGPVEALLDGPVRQVGQLLQFLHQARPTALAHADDRDARVVYVVQFVVRVGVQARYAGGRQGTCGSAPDNRDLPQGTAARLYHAK